MSRALSLGALPAAAALAALPRAIAVAVAWLAGLAAQSGQEVLGPVPLAAVRAVLAELDADFGRGDAAAYAAHFVPDQVGAHAMLQSQLTRIFAETTKRQRTSTIVGAPRSIGNHTVVRVRQQIDLHGGPRALVPHTSFVEECVLVLRTTAAGKCVPTLVVEAAPESGCVQEDRFRCPACNYQIGGVPGWLCVPLRSDRADALEAASFHLLGADVVCDVSVQVDTDCRSPALVAQQFADALRQLEPTAKAALPGSWMPAAHAADPPHELQGASIAIDLPASAAADDRRALLHVVTCGRLQHLLLVRGSATALRAQAPAIAALLASYQWIERDRDLLVAAMTPLEHHTGGVLEGATYRNPRFQVELTGAADWQPVMRTGGTAFRVVWTSPHQSRLWLTGYLVPPGMSRWCEATASRWLEQQCARRDLALLPNAAGSTAWVVDAEHGGAARTLVGDSQKPQGPDAPRRRWFRLLRRDDLLLVVDGFAVTTDDETALQQMLQSIRRR